MRLRFSADTILFCLLKPALSDVSWFTDADAYNSGVFGNVPNQTFRSSPIVAPMFLVNTFKGDAIDSTPFIFLEWGMHAKGSFGPMILRSDDLSLVYADQQYTSVNNVRVQTIEGEWALTFWAGEEEMFHGNGRALAVDSNYHHLTSTTPIDLPSGRLADEHEFQATNDGSVIISIYETVPGWDLTPYGGPPNSSLLDQLFQEIDPGTGELLFQWRVSNNLDIADSIVPYDQTPPGGWLNGYDPFHLNSVSKVGSNYLVNTRNTASVHLVDSTDGSIIWTLGGKGNMFEDLSGGTATSFSHQHHVRLNGNQVTMFDNHGVQPLVDCKENCSRALRVELDFDEMTVKLVNEYLHPRGLVSVGRGGYTPLPNGNALVAWGAQPALTEHRGSEVVMDLQVGILQNDYDLEANQPYRAFKMNWEAHPIWDPSIAVEGNTLFMSWNGATKLEKWAVFTTHQSGNGGTESSCKIIERQGFETSIEVNDIKIARAYALDRDEKIIGCSGVINIDTGKIKEAGDSRSPNRCLKQHFTKRRRSIPDSQSAFQALKVTKYSKTCNELPPDKRPSSFVDLRDGGVGSPFEAKDNVNSRSQPAQHTLADIFPAPDQAPEYLPHASFSQAPLLLQNARFLAYPNIPFPNLEIKGEEPPEEPPNDFPDGNGATEQDPYPADWDIGDIEQDILDVVDGTQTAHDVKTPSTALQREFSVESRDGSYDANLKFSPPQSYGTALEGPIHDHIGDNDADLLDEDMDWDTIVAIANQTDQPDLNHARQSPLAHSHPDPTPSCPLGASPTSTPLNPFARPPFPNKLRDRSPIIGLSSSVLLRTCFRIGELFNANVWLASRKQDGVFELFARVTYSSRESLSRVQYFQFVDLFADQPPYPSGTLSDWRVGSKRDRDSQVFLRATTKESPRYCRCLCIMEKDKQSVIGWALRVRSIRETGWDEIDFVRQATFRDIAG
ncbi:ASST-domain-containing protein [Zalerion maritima]|uniref:ASST-domain-containing protein n=1 Tax=Zalerion maritima TaxID=339359 RepID=A0AAD5RUU4_9PEZI|nr:ASST-domain-containing protein [Zalerion maritima]